MDILYIVISLVLGLLLGVLGFLFLVYLNNKRIQESRIEANLIIENALKKETQILIESKEKALNMLKSKLYQLEIEKKNKEKAKREDTKLKIDFGSQIRNYILHPYKLVKDIRTNIERNDVTKVLDGDIQPFIKEFLLQSQNV